MEKNVRKGWCYNSTWNISIRRHGCLRERTFIKKSAVNQGVSPDEQQVIQITYM